MLKPDKEGTVRLVPSPFLKVVLVVIAAALCIIALRGFIGPSPLYAQSGSGTMDVNIKTIGGSYIYGSVPVEIKDFPYSALKVELKE